MKGLLAAIAGAVLGLLPALANADELKVGNVYRTSVKLTDNLGGVYLPLPPGDWKLIGVGKGTSREGKIPFINGRFMAVELDSSRRPRAFVTFSVATQPSTTGWAQPEFCTRKDLHYIEPKDSRESKEGGQIRCWGILSIGMHPAQNSDPWLLDAYKWVGDNTRGMPTSTMSVQFYRASGFKFVSAFYMFNPEADGFRPLATTSWDRARIESDKNQVAYVDRLRQFGIAWSPTFERGFSGHAPIESNIALPDAANPLNPKAYPIGLAGASINTSVDVTNVDAVPYLKDEGKKAYALFLTKREPRAFALSPTGAFGWSNGYKGNVSLERALNNCSSRSNLPCKIYAINKDVVWGGK